MCVMAREVTDDVKDIAVVVNVATFRADVPMIARMEDRLVLFSWERLGPGLVVGVIGTSFDIPSLLFKQALHQCSL